MVIKRAAFSLSFLFFLTTFIPHYAMDQPEHGPIERPLIMRIQGNLRTAFPLIKAVSILSFILIGSNIISNLYYDDRNVSWDQLARYVCGTAFGIKTIYEIERLIHRHEMEHDI